ncbi:MAG: hypothetical protein P8Z36_02805 [Gemmatimonadota bacterium]
MRRTVGEPPWTGWVCLHDAFSTLCEELTATVVLVTHDLQEAGLLADRLAVLHGGRLEQVADVATLVGAPATDYVRRLVAQAGLKGGA